MKISRLSNEERLFIEKMSVSELSFLAQIGKNPKIADLISLINSMIDYEKNTFFTEREIEPTKLAILHAFSRGGIAKLTMLVHLIGAAAGELQRRGKD